VCARAAAPSPKGSQKGPQAPPRPRQPARGARLPGRDRPRPLGTAISSASARGPEGVLGLDPRTSAERFIRTLKENLLWVRRFATVEELRRALLDFRRCYNATWLVERHGYRTPAQVRADQLGARAAAA